MERLKLPREVRESIPVMVSAESEQRMEETEERRQRVLKRRTNLALGVKSDSKFVEFCRASYILGDPIEAYELVYDVNDPAEAVRLHNTVLAQNTIEALLMIKNNGSSGNKVFGEITVKRIEEYAKLGFRVTEIGKLIGCSDQTISNWLRKGREAEKEMDFDSPFFLFLKRYERAVETGISDKVQYMFKVGTEKYTLKETKTVRSADGSVTETTVTKEHAPQWQALAWCLERIYPERFAKDRITNLKDPKEEAELMANEINKLVAFEGDIIEQK